MLYLPPDCSATLVGNLRDTASEILVTEPAERGISMANVVGLFKTLGELFSGLTNTSNRRTETIVVKKAHAVTIEWQGKGLKSVRLSIFLDGKEVFCRDLDAVLGINFDFSFVVEDTPFVGEVRFVRDMTWLGNWICRLIPAYPPGYVYMRVSELGGRVIFVDDKSAIYNLPSGAAAYPVLTEFLDKKKADGWEYFCEANVNTNPRWNREVVLRKLLTAGTDWDYSHE